MEGTQAERIESMNYFGMIFSFTLPGVIVGILISLAAVQAIEARRPKARAKRIKLKLYVEDLKNDRC